MGVTAGGGPKRSLGLRIPAEKTRLTHQDRTTEPELRRGGRHIREKERAKDLWLYSLLRLFRGRFFQRLKEVERGGYWTYQQYCYMLKVACFDLKRSVEVYVDVMVAALQTFPVAINIDEVPVNSNAGVVHPLADKLTGPCRVRSTSLSCFCLMLKTFHCFTIDIYGAFKECCKHCFLYVISKSNL